MNTYTLSPGELLKSARTTLDENIAALDSGGHVDLSVFDNKARAFCEALAKLPPYEKKTYQSGLKDLIDHLTNVTRDLEMRKAALEEKIYAVNKRTQAYNAYGNALFLALQNVNEE